MTKTLILFLITVVLINCNHRDKKNHRLTVNLKSCNGLFVEDFIVYGQGALGEDVLSDYLTDSTNFRIYIGTYDNANSFFSYKCGGDTIYVQKNLKNETDTKSKAVEKNYYIISKLKKESKME